MGNAVIYCEVMHYRKYQNLEIYVIPVVINSYLGINYIFIIKCLNSGKIICVDPGDFAVVDNFLQKYQLNLDYILITHRHLDHIAGVEYLSKKYGSKIILFKNDNFGSLTGDFLIDFAIDFTKVTANSNVSRETFIKNTIIVNLDNVSRETLQKNNITISNRFKIGQLIFRSFASLGHCANHISYFIENHHILFCGDVLFSSGCGRIHPDGSASEFLDTMQQMRQLPLDTAIFCAHEYTLKNIEFALKLEPENLDLQQKQKDCQKLREQNLPTIPTNLEMELKTNPFLRFDNSALRENFNFDESSDDLAVFTKIRKLKDNF